MEPDQQNKQAKQNQRHGNKEQTDSDQRGGGSGITREKSKRGRPMSLWSMNI